MVRSLMIKIFLVSVIIIFLDLVIQAIMGDHLIEIQEEEYTVLGLIIFFFDILATFMALIIHMITHIFNMEVVIEDMFLLLDGIISLIFWISEGSVELVLHFITILTSFAFSFLPASGFFIDMSVLGSISMEFTTMSFVITIPDFSVSFKADIVKISMKTYNSFGFSLLGVADGQTFKFATLGLSKAGKISIFDPKIQTIWGDRDYGDSLADYASLFVYINTWARGKWKIKIKDPLGIVDITWEVFETDKWGIVDWGFSGSIEAVFAVTSEALGILHPRAWMKSVYDKIAPGFAVTLALHSYYLYLKHIKEVELLVKR